jgi:ABC-type transport system involved in multi-copper enzyme maturation permease subunit
MKIRPVLRVQAALIADTFQEARARWLFWGLFGLSTLLIVIFLFVLKIDLVQGAVSLLGIERTTSPLYDVRRFVNISYSWVSIVLYIWGTFLAIFASSGLIPSVLEPGRIALLLSKPIHRTTLLVGRYIGNLLVVILNHVYLIASIWLIIGWKTHIWEPRFLLAIPISVFIFAVLLTVVVFIGVISESAALSTMVAVALMLISAILAQRQIVVKLLSYEWSRQLWLALYWALPKFYDLGFNMRQVIMFDRTVSFTASIYSSTLFAVAIMLFSLRLFQRKDF